MKKYIASRLVKLPLRESARIRRQSGRGGREQHLHEDPFERPLLLSHLKLLLITCSGATMFGFNVMRHPQRVSVPYQQ